MTGEDELHPDVAVHLRSILRLIGSAPAAELERVRSPVIAAVGALRDEGAKNDDESVQLLLAFFGLLAQSERQRRRIDEMIDEIERFIAET